MKRLVFALWFALPLFATEVIVDQAKIPVLSPELRDQKKLKIRLDNGLEALLISDPHTETSSALMVVKVGSLSDPEEYPGLAHFLEHMLFLGTTKYPKESEYSKYITDHGGDVEAFTTPSSTCFSFYVNNDAFPEALDRFSYFFKEPLFNPTGVNREMHAVDQEYGKNIQNDAIREYYIHKELSNPQNPQHYFSMGNLETLKNVSQDTLKKWYKDHYSANLMRLLVHSNLPLDKLKETVIQDFKEIPNTNKNILSITTPLLLPEYQGKFIYIEPVQDTQKLSLIWELPKKFSVLDGRQTENIVCHILGHEGDKSLLADLKKENLAESLGCGAFKINDDFSEMTIEIDLTEEGLKNIDLVITRIFQAIQRLKETPVPEWLFKEIQNLATIDYQYQSKEQERNFLGKQAAMMPYEPMATYPEMTLILQKYDPKSIQDFADVLTPGSAQYLIMALPSKTLVNPDRQEKWVGGRYAIKNIPEQTLKGWEHVSINPDIDLPGMNKFIPDKIEQVTLAPKQSDKRIPTPQALISDDKATIYFAQDALFKNPKSKWIFTIKTPAIIMADPGSIVLGDVYVKFLEDALNKVSYPAKIAGLDYTIKRAKNGITIEINGYSEKMETLFGDILEMIKSLNPTEEKFAIFKDSLLRKYRNFDTEAPMDQALEIFRTILFQNYVKESIKASTLKDITFQNFQDWFKGLYVKTYIEGVMYGNLTNENAAKAAREIIAAFPGNPYPKNERFEEKVAVIPKNVGPMFLESHTKSLGNATLLAVEEPVYTFKERAVQQILMTAIKDPFFAALRTKQQTGYLVFSLDQEVERRLFNIFLVQSSTHDTRDLLARFEEFIEGYIRELGKTELNQDQFEKIKKALKIYLEENPKNIDEMADLLNELAFKYDGDFDWISKRIQGFDEMTYEEFLPLAVDMLGRGNKRRIAVLLQGVLPEENLFLYNKARSLGTLRKMYEYEAKNQE